MPYLTPRGVFNLILEWERKIVLKWMTIDTSVFIWDLFFESLRSVGKIYGFGYMDFCFGQLKVLDLRTGKLLCSSPSYLTDASEAWLRKCYETFGSNLDTSNILWSWFANCLALKNDRHSLFESRVSAFSSLVPSSYRSAEVQHQPQIVEETLMIDFMLICG